jgi:hypothetical protein
MIFYIREVREMYKLYKDGKLSKRMNVLLGCLAMSCMIYVGSAGDGVKIDKNIKKESVNVIKK